MQIGDGQRITVAAIARPEMPLEVRCPQIVGMLGDGGHDAGMPMPRSAHSLLDQTFARQQVARGADRGQGQPPLVAAQPAQQLARAPRWVSAASFANGAGHLLRNLVRAGLRSVAAILEAVPALCVVPVEPFVAGLPTNPVARTEVGH